MPPQTEGFEELTAIRELPLIQAALRDLRELLPPNLHYHHIGHTENVMKAAYEIAVSEDVGPRDLHLIVIAAAYHDWGYIKRRISNEELGAQRAAEAMRADGGFTEEEIEEVCQAIRDTELERNSEGVMVQRVRGRLSPYLLDADLSGFGRETFFSDNLNVLAELRGLPVSDVTTLPNGEIRAFLETTQKMLLAHEYHTHAAREIFGEQKKSNQQRLAALLDTLNEEP